MKSSSESVAIIGGGISGLTTATLLQLSGYKTRIYTQELSTTENLQNNRSPQFASLHAAASILPHSVRTAKANYWTAISQEYFRVLAFVARCGVREQTHYEIFEQPHLEAPDYSCLLRNFEQLTDVDLLQDGVPRRPTADWASGWRFDVLFCEAPEYTAYLYELYRALGGTVSLIGSELARRSIAEYLKLDYQYYVNCTGHGAAEFLSTGDAFDIDDQPSLPQYEPLNDGHEQRFLRGHYLRVDIKQPFTDARGRFFSYNYTPTAEIYSTASGDPADVYCYPRSDCWILGGSRQIQNGPLDSSGAWTGEETVSEQETFVGHDGKQVKLPAAIFSLNDQLLERLTQGRLSLRRLRSDRPDAILPEIGLRFQRSGNLESVRVACSRVHVGTEKYVFHNYGHGGSGFALSWGCAFDLLKLLDQMTDRQRSPVIPRRGTFRTGHSATQILLAELTQRLLNGDPSIVQFSAFPAERQGNSQPAASRKPAT
ncbi:MAG TPA: FAD-dependent oxidoreductase [Pseudonocardiaceae bacterium]|nr:FAD-dependent oxidoreductase [Pseudonocardiaceae bacterium]